MKNIYLLIAIAIIFCFSQTVAQKNNYEPKSKLLALPLHSKDVVFFNLGVMHVPEVKSTEDIAYNDTILVHVFFRALSKKVDPNKVVLVTEDQVFQYTEDKIQFAQSIWITPQMRKMGFNKWVGADKREDGTAWYFRSYRFITSFLNEYYQIIADPKKVNFFGFDQVSIKQKKTIPKSVADSIIRHLNAIAETQSFEKNIKRVCTMLKKQGYIPVVVAGRAHVLALNEPCLVQVPPKMDEALKKISSDLNLIKCHDLLMKEFLKKYDLKILKK